MFPPIRDRNDTSRGRDRNPNTQLPNGTSFNATTSGRHSRLVNAGFACVKQCAGISHHWFLNCYLNHGWSCSGGNRYHGMGQGILITILWSVLFHWSVRITIMQPLNHHSPSHCSAPTWQVQPGSPAYKRSSPAQPASPACISVLI